MNIQELQVIIDALVALGAEGKSAFVWWLLLDKALPILAFVGGTTVLGGAVLRAIRLVVGDEPALMFLGQRWGLWTRGRLAPHERDSIERRLARMEELYRIHGKG